MFAPGKFRARALQRMTSPEHLDQMLSVTPPRRWVALTALLTLVVTAVVWSVVSTVPTTLSGTGYLVPQDGLREISATASGTVNSINMSVGQHVVAGESLGAIGNSSGGLTPMRAPETGVITETDTAENQFMTQGTRIGLIQPVGFPLVIYAYVGSNVAADLRPGDEAHVLFGAGIGQGFGYAVGTVASVSQFAVTQQRLDFILQDNSTVNAVLKLGPTNEVVIAMELSATTPSGFVWGSGDGPPGALPAGLSANVTFVIGKHHPISEVF